MDPGQKGRTLVFAHRGANREVAENSREAFDRALGYAVDGIETDIQLSRDGIPVLWHDRFLDKIGLPSRHVDDFAYAELKAMDFTGPFAGGAAREGVMGLGEFLEAYRRRCRLLIEIKNRDWEEKRRHRLKVRKCLELVGPAPDTGNDPSILISSFDLESLVFAHVQSPNFPLVYNLNTDQSVDDVSKVLKVHPFLHGFCLPIETLNEVVAGGLRDCGKCVAAYTCNSEEEIAKALALEIDILITDVPAEALRLRS